MGRQAEARQDRNMIKSCPEVRSGISGSKRTTTSKDDEGENKNECLTADCHRGIFDGTWFALRKGVAVNIRQYFPDNPRLMPLKLSIDFSCRSGLCLRC
jgi:hypothetical protein